MACQPSLGIGDGPLMRAAGRAYGNPRKSGFAVIWIRPLLCTCIHALQSYGLSLLHEAAHLHAAGTNVPQIASDRPKFNFFQLE